MFFKKKKEESQYVELPREEWQDWTKEEWINHQPPKEQDRLRTLAVLESDHEFIRWRRKKRIEKQKMEDELRAQGKLPPLEEIPQYGNRPVSINSYFTAGGHYVGYGSGSDNY